MVQPRKNTLILLVVAVLALIVSTASTAALSYRLADHLTAWSPILDGLKGLSEDLKALSDELKGFKELKTVEVSTYPILIYDDFGTLVKIEKEPKRIVSMAPSSTEILYALGLSDRVVGVTRYCNYPSEVEEAKKGGRVEVVGGFVDISIEAVLSLEPDLVVAATTLQLKAVKALRDKGLTVIHLNPKNLDQVLGNVLLLGTATGSRESAKLLVDQLKSRIDKVISRVKDSPYKPRVYHEAWPDPLISVGPGSFIHDLIVMAGGVNIFADATTPYPIVSPEAVITRNPEVIILPEKHGETKYTKEEIKSRPGWSAIDAVKNDRIYIINPDIISRPGPRLVDALELIAKWLHPELGELTIEVTPLVALRSAALHH